MIGIYMYENKQDNKKYIGQSVNITKRKWEHLHDKNSTSKFDNYLRKLGEDCFNFFILEECTTDLLDEREKYWIEFYDAMNPDKGYNLTPGGQSQRGEENNQAKLTNEIVLEIIKLLEENKLDDTQIANKYGMHRNSINNINRCQTWANLHNYKSNIRDEYAQLHFGRNSKSGEGNPTSKITEEKALQIIDALKYESISMPKIAEKLDVSLNIVYDINRCKTWKYLHNYKKNIRNEYKGG